MNISNTKSKWLIKEVYISGFVFLESLIEHLRKNGFICEQTHQVTGKLQTEGAVVGSGINMQGEIGIGIGSLNSESTITAFKWNPFILKSNKISAEALVRMYESARYSKQKGEYIYEIKDYTIEMSDLKCYARDGGSIWFILAGLIAGIISLPFGGVFSLLGFIVGPTIIYFLMQNNANKQIKYYNEEGRSLFQEQLNESIQLFSTSIKRLE